LAGKNRAWYEENAYTKAYFVTSEYLKKDSIARLKSKGYKVGVVKGKTNGWYIYKKK
jgi:hypothetical protein